MKKILLILNNHFSNFWFALFLVVVAAWTLTLNHFLPHLLNFYKTGGLDAADLLLGSLFWWFFIPLAVISLLIGVYIWIKGKNKSYHGFISVIIIIISLASIFFFWGRLNNLDRHISSGELCIKYIGGDKDGECEQIYKD